MDLSKYYLKITNDYVYNRGFGLFHPSSQERATEISFGVKHMTRVLNLLYLNDIARDFVVFPLSIRSPDVDPADSTLTRNCEKLNANINEYTCKKFKSYQIIYPNILLEGFLFCLPNRNEDSKLYDLFLFELKNAIESFINAKVGHYDLYPSNLGVKIVTK